MYEGNGGLSCPGILTGRGLKLVGQAEDLFGVAFVGAIGFGHSVLSGGIIDAESDFPAFGMTGEGGHATALAPQESYLVCWGKSKKVLRNAKRLLGG